MRRRAVGRGTGAGARRLRTSLVATAVTLAGVVVVGPAGAAQTTDGPAGSAQQAAQPIVIDGSTGGRTFDGVGAVSAGASSRLLFDYPEPERSQILDYLFTPGYGAALQILKVEIGSDTNSTDGAEASHMREPGEVDCDRGYEWWLMKQARARNPQIRLAGLEWGAPGWFDGGFWSQDNIEYTIAWLDCAEQHGLDIDYVGGWNERGFDADWLVALDAALAREHPDVEIIAADECCRADLWRVADAMASNPDLKDAVEVVGVHFACGNRAPRHRCESTETARDLGKPLWSSENSAMAHDVGAEPIARALNRMYIDAEMTGFMSWSAVSAWYANLPIGDTGLMVAEWPWSGFYDVGKSIWSYAHTTQFTQPGWRYLDTGSARHESGATHVSLVSPSGEDFSTVVEAMDVADPTTVRFELRALPERTLHLWSTDLRSDDEADRFTYAGTITLEDGAFELPIEPGHLYTVTTTTEQGKGGARPGATVHERLPIPFHENFERVPPGGLARYFSDLNGGFEATPCAGGRAGTCYRQTVTRQPIRWNTAGLMPPTTVFGDPRWWGDYALGAKVMLEQPGYVELIGRVSGSRGTLVGGYHLRIGSDGWSLYSEDTATRTTSEPLAAGDETIAPGRWHEVRLVMRGDTIGVHLDGTRVGEVRDTSQRAGNAALRVSAWQNGQFDDIVVTPTTAWPRLVSKAGMSATASDAHGFYRGWTFEAANAIDDRPETMWHSRFGPRLPPPHSITLDLGGSYDTTGLIVRPRFDVTNGMITEYDVEVSRDGETFERVASGTWPVNSSTKVIAWPREPGVRHVRLTATDGVGGLAAASEIDVMTGARR